MCHTMNKNAQIYTSVLLDSINIYDKFVLTVKTIIITLSFVSEMIVTCSITNEFWIVGTFKPISSIRWRTVISIIYLAGFKIVDVITKSISTQSIITAITSIKVAVSMNVDQVTISIGYQCGITVSIREAVPTIKIATSWELVCIITVSITNQSVITAITTIMIAFSFGFEVIKTYTISNILRVEGTLWPFQNLHIFR